jgi:hypothetical protein
MISSMAGLGSSGNETEGRAAPYRVSLQTCIGVEFSSLPARVPWRMTRAGVENLAWRHTDSERKKESWSHLPSRGVRNRTGCHVGYGYATCLLGSGFVVATTTSWAFLEKTKSWAFAV